MRFEKTDESRKSYSLGNCITEWMAMRFMGMEIKSEYSVLRERNGNQIPGFNHLKLKIPPR